MFCFCIMFSLSLLHLSLKATQKAGRVRILIPILQRRKQAQREEITYPVMKDIGLYPRSGPKLRLFPP